MTELEEKAEEYAHNKMAWCEDYDFDENIAEQYIKQAYIDGYEQGREEINSQAVAILTNKYIVLEKENAELKAELETAQECIVQQQKEYEKLDKKYTEWFTKYHEQIVTVSEQKKQIEKMRCCGFCKHCDTDYKEDCAENQWYDKCDKWELKNDSTTITR